MRSTELLVKSLVGLFLSLFSVVDLETSDSLMPATGELMMLIRLHIMPGVEHAVQIIGVNLCVLLHRPRGSKVLQGSHITNEPGILWSTPPVHICGGRHLQNRSLVWSHLFLLSGARLWFGGGSCQKSDLTASSVMSSSSHLCRVPFSLSALLWPSGLLSFCACFLILTHMVVLILWGWFLYFHRWLAIILLQNSA